MLIRICKLRAEEAPGLNSFLAEGALIQACWLETNGHIGWADGLRHGLDQVQREFTARFKRASVLVSASVEIGVQELVND